jgi:hypothetical protein
MSTHTLRNSAVLIGLVALVLPLAASAQSPVTWNLYLGGRTADGSATYDKPEGVLTDRYGGTFVTGATDAPLFPGTTPQPTVPRAQDAFITYLDNTGRVVKTHIFGGPGDDVGRRLAFNPSVEDHLYIVGTTASPTIRENVPVVGAYRHHGGKDAFLARMRHNGELSWFMYLGGSGDDEGHDVAVFRDPDGDITVYVVGKSENQAAIARVDIPRDEPNNPSVTWSTTFGSAGTDEAYAVGLSEFHQVYVGGAVRGAVSSTHLPLPLNEFGGGASDGFVAELNPTTGAVSWFLYLGGDSDDDVRDLLYQPSLQLQQLVAVGNTRSMGFPPKDPGSGQDIFLVRLNRNNPIDTLKGPQLRLGEGGESMEGHAGVDNTGNIYVGGKTTSTTLAFEAFDPKYQFDPSRPPDNDGFVAMVDPELTGRVWSSYVGGPASAPEAVMGLSAVPEGQLTFVGHSTAPTKSGLLVVDTGDDRSSAKGGEDGFVFRLPVDPKIRAPLGWSCSSVSGGGPLSLLTLALLALRRARRRPAR